MFEDGEQSLDVTVAKNAAVQKSDALELTPDQYRKYIETNGDEKEKIYMVVSHDPAKPVGNDNEIYCLNEYEKTDFMKAISIIEKYCEGQNLTTDEQKLRYAASKLPEPFSKGTKYAASRYMKVVES